MVHNNSVSQLIWNMLYIHEGFAALGREWRATVLSRGNVDSTRVELGLLKRRVAAAVAAIAASDNIALW